MPLRARQGTAEDLAKLPALIIGFGRQPGARPEDEAPVAEEADGSTEWEVGFGRFIDRNGKRVTFEELVRTRGGQQPEA